MTGTLKPLLRADELQWKTQQHGDAFAARFASLAKPLGLSGLGCRLVEIPPGKRGWPFHHHFANDELFYILDGCGLWRFGDQTYPVKAGDCLAAPSGGPETAHQLINDSDKVLRYLAISTMHAPDVGGYPDSGKFFVMAGSAPGGPPEARRFEHIGRLSDRVDYWEGE